MKWHVNATDFVLKFCTWTSEAVSGVLNVIQKTHMHSGRLLSVSPCLADHRRKIVHVLDDFFWGGGGVLGWQISGLPRWVYYRFVVALLKGWLAEVLFKVQFQCKLYGLFCSISPNQYYCNELIKLLCKHEDILHARYAVTACKYHECASSCSIVVNSCHFVYGRTTSCSFIELI